MKIYFIIYLILIYAGLGVSLAKHGKEIKKNSSIFIKVLSTSIVLFLLCKAGFFNQWQWPQISYLVIFGFSVGLNIAGVPKKYNFFYSLLYIGIVMVLFYHANMF